MPGKAQKQNSTRIVKNSRDPVYNEEFFFDNVSEADIASLSLAVKVCHKIEKQFQKDVAVGEIDEALTNFPTLTSKKELKVARYLRPKLIKVILLS